MKWKDIGLTMLFAFMGTLAIHYFFPGGTDTPQVPVTDRHFVAPTTLQVLEPFEYDINFAEASPTRKKEITVVQVPYGTLQFSNDGAILEYFGYTHHLDGKTTLLETVVPSQSKEQGAFLVVFDGLGKTPYYYDLIEKIELDRTTILTYKGASSAALVLKKFTVHHATPVIDVQVTVEPLNAEVRPRLFFPAPHLISDTLATINAVLASGTTIEKTAIKELAKVGVEKPTIFGLENKYFAQVLFKDPEQFAQRAYFKTDQETVQAILQGTASKERKTWNLSFYMGPQEMSLVAAVDPRLEGLLSYGWFSPISKLLMLVLNFLYGIFKNYGLAIIVLTVLMRLVLVPFTPNPEKTRKKSAEAQKKLAYIEQRYKDNPEELSRAKEDYARKHALPGMIGCLPLLLQAPVFIGLQRVLSHSFELYQAPFLWIPDLSNPDPYYIFPMLFGAGLALQLAQMGDVRQRLVNVLLAIIAASISANLSAGLTLFMCVSTLAGLAHSALQKALA